MFWLNAAAPANAVDVLVALDVSHAEIFALNDDVN